MHENLWASVDLKLEEAQRAFEEMGRPLQPPERTQNYAAQVASGAVVDNRWQDSCSEASCRSSG
jgi:hypothetical protein